MSRLSAVHRQRVRHVGWLLPLLLLTACIRQDMASYMIDGNKDHSLSLMREAYAWDDRWQLKLVTTHMPDCMRRHDLASASRKRFRLDIYQPASMVYILHQGAHWYVTDMQQCRLQVFDEPPPVPGRLLGSFLERKGELNFVAAQVEDDTVSGALGPTSGNAGE